MKLKNGRICVITICAILHLSVYSNTLEDFNECRKSKGFSLSGQTLICDSRNDLKPETVKKLSDILKHVQTKLQCECTELCARDTDLDGKFVGLLQVTNTAALNETGKAFNDVASEIYELAGLGNADCDNGMLLFYVKDTQELASMRGHNKFILLKDQDLDRLHQIASGNKTDDLNAVAMEFLVDKDNATSGGSIQTFLKSASNTWAPIVGLVVVGVLLLFILALLLACCLAKLCGCCSPKPNKNKYYVTPMPTYKTVDPIYIVTPPSDRHDLIYSTPYSGSPLPPPPTMYMTTPPPPIHSSGYSTYGSPRSPRSPLHTPNARKSDTLGKTSPMKIDRAGTSKSNYSFQNSSSTTLPMSDGIHELPYLEPKRKMETQTREELIE